MPSFEAPTRNLAAVLFADIVGYTQLAFDDEDHAYRLAMVFQSVTKDCVLRYAGSVVKFTGDGTLAVFPSADSAVRAGLALASDFKLRCQSSGGEQLVRVGIHLGDVVTAVDGDVYGDGVNTASRLQQIAEAGQVVASEDVWRQLRHRSDFDIQALGRKALKGLPDPIDLFLIRSGPQDNNAPAGSLPHSPVSLSRFKIAAAVALVALFAGGVYYWTASSESEVHESETEKGSSSVSQIADSTSFKTLSIVVLPLADLSSKGDMGYFADGMTEELTTRLAQLPELMVVSRTSAYEYRDGADVRIIGEDLGVRTILEGSVRAEGDTVRITIQLINAYSGYHLWSKSYDAMVRNTLAMQQEVALQVVDDLKNVLSPLSSNPHVLTMD
jgi:adenylate cyclase